VNFAKLSIYLCRCHGLIVDNMARGVYLIGNKRDKRTAGRALFIS
jgi:hypothetical protein